VSKAVANSAGSSPRLAQSCLILTAALLAVFPAFAYFGYLRSGASGLTAAGVAGGVCWLAGLVSLMLIGTFRGQQAAVNALLLAILVRTGLPLVVGLVLTEQGGELARAGVFGMILGYYLVALVVDTLLSVRLLSSGKESLS